MDCENIKGLLLEYVYDELDPAGRRKVEEHVRSCPECARELAEMEATLGAVRTMEEPEMPPYLNTRVKATIASEAPVEKKSILAVLMRPRYAAAAAVVLAATVAILMSSLIGNEQQEKADDMSIEEYAMARKKEVARDKGGESLDSEYLAENEPALGTEALGYVDDTRARAIKEGDSPAVARGTSGGTAQVPQGYAAILAEAMEGEGGMAASAGSTGAGADTLVDDYAGLYDTDADDGSTAAEEGEEFNWEVTANAMEEPVDGDTAAGPPMFMAYADTIGPTGEVTGDTGTAVAMTGGTVRPSATTEGMEIAALFDRAAAGPSPEEEKALAPSPEPQAAAEASPAPAPSAGATKSSAAPPAEKDTLAQKAVPEEDKRQAADPAKLVAEARKLELERENDKALTLYEEALVALGYTKSEGGGLLDRIAERTAEAISDEEAAKQKEEMREQTPAKIECNQVLDDAVKGALRMYDRENEWSSARGLRRWYDEKCPGQK